MKIKKDDLRVGCFERTGCLIQFIKFDVDIKIRPQWAESKIDIPLIHTHVEEGSKFVAPTREELINRNVNSDIIYESSEVIAEGDTFGDEVGVKITTTEFLDDFGFIYSDD